MYKIIGADGKEYGPITLEQLKQWIAEGRLNLQSKVLPEGGMEWKTVAEIPELAASVPAPSSPIGGGYAATPNTAGAAEKVAGPAIGLMVTAGLGILVQVLSLGMNLFGSSIMASQAQGNEAFAHMFSGAVGAVMAGLGIVVAIVIFMGALKMKKLQSFGFAMTVSVVAMLPCVSPCCVIGLPIGVWALIVLNKPEVKAAFS